MSGAVPAVLGLASLVAALAFGALDQTAIAVMFVAIALCVAAARPRAGLYMVLLTAPVRGAFPLPILDCSVTRALGVAMVIGAAVGWAAQRRWPSPHRAVWVLAALVALAASSLLPARGDPAVWLVLAQYLVFAVVVADLADSERSVVEMAVVLCASALAAALMMLGDYLSFALHAQTAEAVRFEWWVDPQSTLLAAFFGSSAFAALFALSRSLGRRWRWTLWAMLLPPLIAVVVLTSRMTWLALVSGLVAYTLAGGGVHARARQAGVIAGTTLAIAAVTAALGLWDPGMTHRVVHSTDSAYEATSGRTVIWTLGWSVFAQHPARGVGVGGFPEAFEELRVRSDPPARSRPLRNAHNDFLGLAAEVGVLGPVLLAWALLWMALPAIRGDASAHAPAALGWLTYLAVLMLGLDMRDQWHVWVGFGLVMGASARVIRSRPGPPPRRA